jgi:hypothetical protein
MGTYNFEIRHKIGEEMPTDSSSRYPIDGLKDFHDTLYLKQQIEHLCQEINYFLENNENTPHSAQH